MVQRIKMAIDDIILTKLTWVWEETTMANDMANVIKFYSENAYNSTRKLNDLNLRIFEIFTSKQAEFLKSYVELGTQHAEAMSKARTPAEIIVINQETVNEVSKEWMNKLREVGEMLTDIRDEMFSIAEEAVQYTQASAEQTFEAGKKMASEAAEKIPHTMEKASNEVAGMAKDVAEKSQPQHQSRAKAANQ